MAQVMAELGAARFPGQHGDAAGGHRGQGQKVMAAHVDILDQPDRLAGWFLGSLGLHVGLVVALLSYGVLFSRRVRAMGQTPRAAAWGQWQ